MSKYRYFFSINSRYVEAREEEALKVEECSSTDSD
jgi:hypothetical protein